MSAEHTPGPWRVCGIGQEWPGIEADECSVIIFGSHDEECGVKGRSHDEAVANARLIAAAPNMLAALNSACESFAQIHKFNRLPAGENNQGWRDARAAIARAESRQ